MACPYLQRETMFSLLSLVSLPIVIELLHMMMLYVYSACIQLVVSHVDDVYMLFHMLMMCTVHIFKMYSACIGRAGCLPVTYYYHYISL